MVLMQVPPSTCSDTWHLKFQCTSHQNHPTPSLFYFKPSTSMGPSVNNLGLFALSQSNRCDNLPPSFLFIFFWHVNFLQWQSCASVSKHYLPKIKIKSNLSINSKIKEQRRK